MAIIGFIVLFFFGWWRATHFTKIVTDAEQAVAFNTGITGLAYVPAICSAVKAYVLVKQIVNGYG